MTDLALRALGVAVTVRGADGPAAATIRDRWRHCLADADATTPDAELAPPTTDAYVDLHRTGDGWRAVTDDRAWTLPGSADDDAALAAASTAVNHLVTSRTPRLAFHAAVARHGTTYVVLPGASGAGKTTLVAALLLTGWALVSDETLAIGPSGDLLAYPRPLAVSDWTRDALGLATTAGVRSAGETWLLPADLGSTGTTDDAPPAHPRTVIVVPDRTPSAAPTLTTEHRAEAVAALVPRGFTLHRDPAAALLLLADLARASDVVRLTYDDPRAAAAVLSSAVSTEG